MLFLIEISRSKIIDSSFLCFDDVINIMLVFFPLSLKYFAFLAQIGKKCAVSQVSTKNRIIWDTDSINIWILADEACRCANFSNIFK